MSQTVADLIFRMFTILLAITAPTIAIVLGMAEYNKRKIAEARERSVGAEAIAKLRKDDDDRKKQDEEFRKEMREENREFRKDIYQMMFDPRTPQQ